MLLYVLPPEGKEHTRLILGYNPQTIILVPHNLNDILTNIIKISEKIDRIAGGQKLVQTLEDKIHSGQDKLSRNKSNSNPGSKILCLGWLEPSLLQVIGYLK